MNVAATNSAVYGLTTKARCLSAITAESESDKIRFLVGTCVLKEENEVHLVELQEDENEIKCLSIYNHQSEIWSLEPSPQDASLFFTTYTVNNGSNMKASLWKIKEEERNGVLEEVMQLQTTDNADIRRVIWNPEGGERNSILSTDANNIRIWNLNSSNAASVSSQLSIGELQTISSVTWNPLHNEQLASSNESSIRGWDLRTKKETYCIPTAHAPFVRDIDFNPNKDYYMVTGGDDYKIKFWDVRKCDKPVKILEGHSHWIWSVKYNRQYDQLLLSASTDSLVNLYNVVSISSAAAESAYKGSKNNQDHLIKSFEEHEDSVYSIAWSSSPWIFASLSYDGRVVMNRVPKEYADLILM